MRAVQVRKFKEQLVDLQQTLGHRAEGLLVAIQEQDSPPGEHESRVSPAGTTEADWAVEQAEEGIGEKILAALARIGDGTYGVCQECGKGIAVVRLKSIPYATHCVHCERRQENRLD
jgi:DnaK suppressor protein